MSGDGAGRRILFVTASDDDRASTAALHAIVAEMGRRPDLAPTVWFLRGPVDEDRWVGAAVVDRLRTLPAATLLDRLGARPLGDAVRGAVLRGWFRSVDPDVVVLDDGLGARVLDRRRRRHLLAVRRNPELPADAALEPRPLEAAGLIIGEPDDPPPTGVRVLDASADVFDVTPSVEAGTPSVTSARRRALGLPDDAVVVSGWGEDGWLDGPDLFVRLLWTLERRHGVAAHGVWVATEVDEVERRRLVGEAERCGVADRYRIVDHDDLPNRVIGDAVFLPARVDCDRAAVLRAVVSGATVVTFPTHAVDDPAVVVVGALDLDAAAAAIAAALDAGVDRSTRSADAVRRLAALDVRRHVDALIGAFRDAGVTGTAA